MNNVEGWHHGFYQTLNKEPHILKFVDAIKLEQSSTENAIIEISTGRIKKRANKYEMLNRRIDEVVKDFKFDKAIDYLKNLVLIIDY